MQIYILPSLAVPKILLGVGNAVIDSVSMTKSAITQVDSAVLFSQMALLIRQTGELLFLPNQNKSSARKETRKGWDPVIVPALPSFNELRE